MFENRLCFKKCDERLLSLHVDAFKKEYESKEVGYYYLPDSMEEVLHEVDEIDSEDIEDILVIGIGGSSLGAKAISTMIGEKKRKLHFLENLDSSLVSGILKKLHKKSVKIFVISKSGTTLETLSLLRVVLHELNIQKSEFSSLLCVVTDPNSKLENFAKKHSIKYFHIPKNVGGRFSVFSSCGIVPLTLCGYDTKALLEGARACKREYIEEENLDIFQKAYRYCFSENENINVVFSYSNAFREFNAWYIQLWAESLGKKSVDKRVGLTPVGLIGSIDQHSFLQLIVEGVRDKTVTFIKQKEEKIKLSIADIELDFLPNDVKNIDLHEVLNMQCDATLESVKAQGISTDLIELDTLDEWHVGYLMYYYELLTSICGVMFGINTYNQPGVEIGKKILKDMLKSQA